MARENPIETAVWIALGVGAVAVTGVVVYVATRPAAAAAPPPAPLTGPAITNPAAGGQGSSVASAANAAFVAQQNAAAAAAAANAAALAPLVNTTYQLALSGQAPSATDSFQIKVGDTIRIIPSITGDPPVARSWTYTPEGTQSILTELGSSDGISATFQGTAVGSGTLLVQNVAVGNQADVYMTYTLSVNVVAA
jgi:hypothetical protein